MQAFESLGGKVREREPGRFQIRHVPAAIRTRDRLVGVGAPVLTKYERITFEKALISVPGIPLAEFISPGHPLLGSIIDLVLERHRDVLRQGAVLIDPTDSGMSLRVMFYLQQDIQDTRIVSGNADRVISREVHFVEVDAEGNLRAGGVRRISITARRLITKS